MHSLSSTKAKEAEDRKDTRQPDAYVRQVEDHSLAAAEVLKEQRDLHAPEDLPRVYVP